ncbi:2-oxo-4-hydroxy-4-carboxy-5-ureidoimidazoline decarboxylase [Jannaschia faecimaris]|uniref:2-oxo-4-hydroxy-4-carboxy-5-ureidoimidazoline decarboxylase n=1 Tax=Jannaschia faecimaris TaxID=1244108 RepID=A0A1H3S5R4_9RHOB|nr:2-oxo-4-hydroxy-4-carboxy-5-ureidoimidazoline decarboxylase [Jannaschia faecimaris]SDZ32851.1 2-oxo-4-hydroxy-4-carboxy-5-ureidoimidazoline decarboxylase [Jannaschia faecimaris]
MTRLGELNTINEEQAAEFLEPLIERAPNVAARVARHRPFNDLDGLQRAIQRELLALDEAESLDLFRAHSDLAPDNPLSMTGASQSEQGRLDLTDEGNTHRARLVDLNKRYRERFGFPFITALVRHHDINSVLAEFEGRLAEDRTTEIARAIEQISIVSLERVRLAFGCDEMVDVTRKPMEGEHDI